MEVLSVPAQPLPAPAGPGRRSKKGKRKGLQQQPDDSLYVNVVPLSSIDDALDKEWQPLQLSQMEKAAQASLSNGNLTVTMRKGYRMARATKGAYQGTWYFEVRVDHLGETGHARLGWSTRRGDLQGPVGYDEHSMGYRDLEGSKVHRALREPYGAPFSQGDTIGCFLHLPQNGRSLEKGRAELLSYRSAPVQADEPDPEPNALPGSLVGFTRNGHYEGVAYRDFLEGTYYPAASLFTHPSQLEGASVTFNFGPHFDFAVPEVEGCPHARPISEVAGEPPALGALETVPGQDDGLAKESCAVANAPV